MDSYEKKMIVLLSALALVLFLMFMVRSGNAQSKDAAHTPQPYGAKTLVAFDMDYDAQEGYVLSFEKDPDLIESLFVTWSVEGPGEFDSIDEFSDSLVYTLNLDGVHDIFFRTPTGVTSVHFVLSPDKHEACIILNGKLSAVYIDGVPDPKLNGKKADHYRDSEWAYSEEIFKVSPEQLNDALLEFN